MTLYTVPAGKVAIIKCITTYFDGAGGGQATWIAAGRPFATPSSSSAAATNISELSVVLNAGDTIGLIAAGCTMQVTASGYLLDV